MQIVYKGVAGEEEGVLLGCDVDHSLPYNAEVKNKWSNNSTFPTSLYDMYS